MNKVSERWNSQSSLEIPENHNGAVPLNKTSTDDFESDNELPSPTSSTTSAGQEAKVARRSDLAKALDTDLSKLDSMIEQAENAQYSMTHQSKQMKRFLK